MNNKKLLQLIYDDIDHDADDAKHVKFIAIHRWIHQVKKQKQSAIVKDHQWLFVKILHHFLYQGNTSTNTKLQF